MLQETQMRRSRRFHRAGRTSSPTGDHRFFFPRRTWFRWRPTTRWSERDPCPGLPEMPAAKRRRLKGQEVGLGDTEMHGIVSCRGAQAHRGHHDGRSAARPPASGGWGETLHTAKGQRRPWRTWPVTRLTRTDRRGCRARWFSADRQARHQVLQRRVLAGENDPEAVALRRSS